MTLSELNSFLRNKAIKFGLCQEWQNTIWNCELSYSELLDIYIKGFDFSLDNDWLDYEFCKREFPAEELHAHNIYIDEDVDLEGENGYYIFIGHCTGKVTFDGLYAATVYVLRDSNISVCSYGGARTLALVYDRGRILSRSDNFSHIKVLDRRNKK